jgi:hypothetical protein
MLVVRQARSYAVAAFLGGFAAMTANAPAHAAKATECTKINVCYCVNTDLRPTIDAKIARFRQLLAEQRKAGKLVGYMSVPLSPSGGGNFDVNKEVAEGARTSIEKRFGGDQVFVLNPGTLDADLPSGASGADYMLMWTALLEGPNGLGEDLDFVYFVGPQDFARYFALDGNGDMAKIDQFFDKRVKTNPSFEKAAKDGLSKTAFRNYYGLKASTAFSRGAHDEWNIIRTVNERRRNEPVAGLVRWLRHCAFRMGNDGVGRLRRQMRDVACAQTNRGCLRPGVPRRASATCRPRDWQHRESPPFAIARTLAQNARRIGRRRRWVARVKARRRDARARPAESISTLRSFPEDRKTRRARARRRFAWIPNALRAPRAESRKCPRT